MKKFRWAVLVALVMGILLAAGSAMAEHEYAVRILYVDVNHTDADGKYIVLDTSDFAQTCTESTVGSFPILITLKNKAKDMIEVYKNPSVITSESYYYLTRDENSAKAKSFDLAFRNFTLGEFCSSSGTIDKDFKVVTMGATTYLCQYAYCYINDTVDIDGATISSLSVDYNGSDQKPTTVTANKDGSTYNLTVDTDCTIEWKNKAGNVVTELKNAGTYTGTVSLIGTSYTGTISGTVSFTINQVNLDGAKIAPVTYNPYDGDDHIPDSLNVTLGTGPDAESWYPSVGSDKDCTIVWTNSKGETVTELIDADTYTGKVTFTDTGNYKGTPSNDATIIIQVCDLNNSDLVTTVVVSVWPYTDKVIKMDPTVKVLVIHNKKILTLVKDTDYELEFVEGEDFLHVGKGKIKITGIGNFKGTVDGEQWIQYAIQVSGNQYFTGSLTEAVNFDPKAENKPEDTTAEKPTFINNVVACNRFDGQTATAPAEGVTKDQCITIPAGWVGKINYTVIANCTKYGPWGTSVGNYVYVYAPFSASDVTVQTSETGAAFTWAMPHVAIQGYNIYLDGSFVEKIKAKSELEYSLRNLEAGSTHKLGIQPVYTIEGEAVAEKHLPINEITFTTQEAASTEKVVIESFKIKAGNKRNLSGKTLKLKLGKKQKLNAYAIEPANATVLKLKYRSSNTNVCTVKNGLLVAKKTGTATITISARGGSSAKVVFKVKVVK